MPVVPIPLPASRVQPASRTHDQHLLGSHTLVSDRHQGFAFVKPVAWVRNRAGDENHWTKHDVAPRHVAVIQPHAALLEFQNEQAKIQQQKNSKANTSDCATTSSIYGAHTIENGAAAASTSSSSTTSDQSSPSPSSSSARINNIASAQILEQQSKVWAPLESTSKRLGFGVTSKSREGTQLYEIEKQQDKARFQSVSALSYSNSYGTKRAEIAVPESMNRTSSLFPLSPVNKFASTSVSSTMRNPKMAAAAATAAKYQKEREECKEETQSEGQQQPVTASQPQNDTYSLAHSSGMNVSTAHSLGYGKRHTFQRHYLSSVPDL